MLVTFWSLKAFVDLQLLLQLNLETLIENVLLSASCHIIIRIIYTLTQNIVLR